MSTSIKTCSVCFQSTEDSEDNTLKYGAWMHHKDLTVHYFCLLLSPNLMQRGTDNGGILGFLVADIRIEIARAKESACHFCEENGATVACSNCGIMFHLTCMAVNRCITEFCHSYRSYCNDCQPRNDYQKQLLQKPPENQACYICQEAILVCYPHIVTYGDCCRGGFAHLRCMRRYALSAGYYLRCIWCRNTDFRDSIRLQNVFVPDRDAAWELERNAYRDLHRQAMRCDLDECQCPNGRQFNSNSWKILVCKLCGSGAAHGKCVDGVARRGKSAASATTAYTCTVCCDMQEKVANESRTPDLNTSLYVKKTSDQGNESAKAAAPVFSDEESCEEPSSPENPASEESHQSEPVAPEVAAASPVPETETIELTDSQSPELPVQKKPLVLKQSFEVMGEPHFYLVVYDFRENFEKQGSYTLRFEPDDPRIEDCSAEALRYLDFGPDDIWFYDDEDRFDRNAVEERSFQ
ncbi:hypothetical protein KR018_002091 [Drosophila ironensis]|nr:hypothetical protein KR018_002091 [Drosophila ironensis]